MISNVYTFWTFDVWMLTVALQSCLRPVLIIRSFSRYFRSCVAPSSWTGARWTLTSRTRSWSSYSSAPKTKCSKKFGTNILQLFFRRSVHMPNSWNIIRYLHFSAKYCLNIIILCGVIKFQQMPLDDVLYKSNDCNYNLTNTSHNWHFHMCFLWLPMTEDIVYQTFSFVANVRIYNQQ